MRTKRNQPVVAFYMPWIGPLLAPTEGSPATGGAETQILMLSRELVRSDIEVVLVVANDPALPTSLDGIRVTQLPRWSSRTDLRLVGTAIGFAGLLVALLKIRPTVVVQRMGSARTGWCALASSLLRARFVWSSANRTDFSPDSPNRSRLESALLKYGARHADRIVVQTEEQAGLCRKAYGRKASLIRSLAENPGLDLEKTHDAIWVGRATDYKRPEDFLELTERLPMMSFRMILVPSAESDLDEVEQLSERGSGIPNLELLGPQPRAVATRMIAQSKLLISTSSVEGMPNVFLEAWGSGVPTLALHHDPDEIVANNDLGGFAAGSIESLALLCRRLLEDPAAYARTSARCRQYVATNHDPKAVAAMWSEQLLGP